MVRREMRRRVLLICRPLKHPAGIHPMKIKTLIFSAVALGAGCLLLGADSSFPPRPIPREIKSIIDHFDGDAERVMRPIRADAIKKLRDLQQKLAKSDHLDDALIARKAADLIGWTGLYRQNIGKSEEFVALAPDGSAIGFRDRRPGRWESTKDGEIIISWEDGITWWIGERSHTSKGEPMAFRREW